MKDKDPTALSTAVLGPSLEGGIRYHTPSMASVSIGFDKQRTCVQATWF